MGTGWSKVTGLKTFVTQAQYEAGQHVSGEVFANILSEIQFSRLTLEIYGVEAISYRSPPRRKAGDDEEAVAKTVEAKEKKELFKSRAILFQPADGCLPPGRYRFPFLFVLPSDLPGSASVAGADVGRDEAGEYSAEVKYLVRAEFEDCCILVNEAQAAAAGAPASALPPTGPGGTPSSGAAAVTAAVAAAAAARIDAATAVNEEQPGGGEAAEEVQRTKPSPGEGDKWRFPLKLVDALELFVVESRHAKTPPHLVDQRVESRGCLPCMKPSVVVAALWLNNTVVLDGDTFEVNVEVENPSRHPLNEVVLAVWRVTTLRAPGLRPYVVRNRMLYQQVSSIPPGYYFRGDDALHVDIQIPQELQQTVHASLFDVTYEVALTADFRRSSFNVRDGLVIIHRAMPQPEHLKGIKAPPGWENVDLTTNVMRIQLEGAAAPHIGDYEGIGYVRQPRSRSSSGPDTRMHAGERPVRVRSWLEKRIQRSCPHGFLGAWQQHAPFTGKGIGEARKAFASRP
ncbi:hypothetical protein Esti_001751 [Eimeria stiedai]